MKKKTFLALLLALCMLVSMLAGCGSSEEPANDQPNNPGESQPAGDENPGTPDDEPGETVNIVVGCMSFAPVDEAVQTRIENAVNEKMKELINVTADFMWFDASSYGTQIPMMITSNEQLDAIMFTPVPSAGFDSFVNQGQLMDIAEYVDQYGPDIKAELGEAGLAGTTRDGKLLGVGGVLAQSAQYAILMRTDALEATGHLDDFKNMKTWTEFETILKDVVAAGYPGIANSDAEGSVLNTMPYLAGDDNFANDMWIDCGGDGNQQVYIDPADDTFKCVYDSEAFKQLTLRAGSYYSQGLIYKDSATSMDYAASQVKNGVASGYTNQIDFGGESAQIANCGYDMTFKYLDGTQNLLSTATFNKFGWAVPVTSREPEAAVKFINLLYSENAVHDTLTWGEEGVDWVRQDDGTAAYPNGGTSAEYHMSDFMYGNILTVPVWDGEAPDLRDQQRASNTSLKASKYVGFAIDKTPVLNLDTACRNVSNEYKPMLSSGAYGDNTEAKLQEYIEALYAAGMAEVLAEYQSQLDAWLAAQ